MNVDAVVLFIAGVDVGIPAFDVEEIESDEDGVVAFVAAFRLPRPQPPVFATQASIVEALQELEPIPASVVTEDDDLPDLPSELVEFGQVSEPSDVDDDLPDLPEVA